MKKPYSEWTWEQKEKNRAKARAYAATHREERRAYSKVYDFAHREERKAQDKASYESNPEEGRAIAKAWKTAHPDKVRAYRVAHKEKQRAYSRNWWNAHPEERLAKHHKRLARIAGNGGSYTVGEWELLKKRYGYCCPSCGSQEPEIKLTVDHIIPISKGGINTIENIQPLCLSCNSRKRNQAWKLLPNEGQVSLGV